jgi:hypothetical protein
MARSSFRTGSGTPIERDQADQSAKPARAIEHGGCAMKFCAKRWACPRGALKPCVPVVLAVFFTACGARSELLVDAESVIEDPGTGTADAGGGSATPSDAASKASSGDGAPSGDDAGRTEDAENGSPSFDAAGIDASEAVPCLLGGDVFSVDGEGGYPGISGSSTIAGSQGTWGGRLTSEIELQLTVETSTPWVFAAGLSPTSAVPLVPGTYVSTGDGHGVFAQVQAAGGGCGAVPTGSFTIAEIESTGGDEATLTRLLAWFDLTCPLGGTVRGCVSYQR